MRAAVRWLRRNSTMHYPGRILGWMLLAVLVLVSRGDEIAGSSTSASDHACVTDQGKRSMPGPFGCTIVMTRRDGLVLIGNNEDRNNTATRVSMVPANEKFYGRIMFGYADAPIQGGMNDQGLFIDANAVRSTGWTSDSAKPTCSWALMATLLATCATCEDVKTFFEKYNVPALDLARFPIADQSGASMVVEYAHGQVQFVTTDKWYQIATNFIMSNVTGSNYPCWRYRAADSMLSEAKTLDVDLVRRILATTHQEGGALTVYSNIYDLKKGIVYVYNLRDFDEVVVMDLCDELNQGERWIELPSLFAQGVKRLMPPQ
jgi:hypothetical protein